MDTYYILRWVVGRTTFYMSSLERSYVMRAADYLETQGITSDIAMSRKCDLEPAERTLLFT